MSMDKLSNKELDPRGLITESYNIDGITMAECRSIFFDWAMSAPQSDNIRGKIEALLTLFSKDNPSHPMTDVLREGLEKSGQPRRRGGARSRER